MTIGEWLVAHEASVRLMAFAAVLLALRLGEWRWTLRGDSRAARRHVSNIGLLLVSTGVLRVAFPVLAVVWAAGVHERAGGLLGLTDWPAWLEIVVALLLLDLAIYWQHRLMHAVPLLWRMHRVHHSDTAFDVTTGVRFHPFEIALSMAYKLAIIALLGPAALAVILFELVLSVASLFTHADVALPPRVDRAVRRLLVTPSMHRIHHSVRREETDSNFGFDLTVWDRLFGTYRDAPAQPESRMPIGLTSFRDAREQGLIALLVQPFRSGAADA